MRLFCLAVAIALLGYCDVEGRVSINGIQTGLSRIGGNFARIPVELDDVARIAGYNFAALGTYWRSNTLAGFAQMKRGEMQEAMETFNLAVATLAVWDLGQGVLYQIADTLVNKVILKYQDDFQRTLNAFFDYNKFMGAEFLSGSTTVGESKVLKAKLMDAQGDIAKAFQLDVETGMTKFTKNSQIYADLVTDLKGIKTWAKVAKYADVLAGPLFDAATVAVSAWQLAEAIKNKDPVAIGSSSLALASGLAGLTGFVVGALATAGSTLAAVAGPIGAIIGAVLGIASILVEIFGSLNPYPRIDNDIDMLNQLKVVSKQVLDADFQNLEKVIPSAANFEFSWIYEVNQGHLIEYIRGRGDYNEPVKFRLDKTGRAEDGYMVVGEMQVFDKGNYPGNFFWNPSGTVNLGYDFYGKKSTEELKGVTVIAGTNLVSGKGVELKGLDIVTYETTEDNFPDSVVIDDMYDIAFQNNIAAKTGAGSDVIAINGLIGKPGHPKYYEGYGAKLSISTTVDDERPTDKKECNILSFEGMPHTKKHEYSILGVYFDFKNGYIHYISDKEGEKKKYFWGTVKGITMFVGTPFDDVVRFPTEDGIAIRETRGRNQYIMITLSWGPFSITIDDQCEEPGKLTISSINTYTGKVLQRHLVYSPGTKTLIIYAHERWQRWHIRGRVFFNRKRDGHPMIRTEADELEIKLNELPKMFEPKEETESIRDDQASNFQYHFDRNLKGGCPAYEIYLNKPDFQRGRYTISLNKIKNTLDDFVVTKDFVDKCLMKAKRSFHFICTDTLRDVWMMRLLAPNGLDSVDCPGKDLEVIMYYEEFERLFEQEEGGGKRLLIDFRTENRAVIDVKEEITKLDTRIKFHFDRDVQGQVGVPQALELEVPAQAEPTGDEPIKTSINLRGGKIINRDIVVFTQRLREWLKQQNMEILLIKAESGGWYIRLKKSGGARTHRVRLFNIESIVYEPTDRMMILPIVHNTATETETTIDLEERTKTWEAWARKPKYRDSADQCRSENQG